MIDPISVLIGLAVGALCTIAYELYLAQKE